MTKPTLLIVSFTDISADARVKKQALLFADRYTVVTCGYGESVREDIEHIHLEPVSEVAVGWKKYLEAAFVRTHAYSAASNADLRAKQAIRLVSDRRFDAVIANELETLNVAYSVVPPARVHLDLHEYYPGLRDDIPVWVRVRKPYQQWLLRNRAIHAGSATTVSETIARRYREEFGLECGVVRNAAPYHPELRPGSVEEPIRIVHSGVSAENRRPEVMMEAVAKSRTNVTLDLYLTQQHTPFGQRLHAMSAELGDRITIHPPVPNAELVQILNSYDVGIHILAPTNTNNSLALPNKFFDFVQARLGMIIGPTVDMATLLEQYELGEVADGFDVDDVIAVLDNLDREKIVRWKAHADEQAETLSAERQQDVWLSAVEGLLAR